MASSTPTGSDATATTEARDAEVPTAEATIPDDWESIRYVFYLVVGWLVATVVAVGLLMFVVPSMF